MRPVIVAVLALACTPELPDDPDTGPFGDTDTESDTDTDTDIDTDPGTDPDTDPDTGNDVERELVCARWNDDRVDLSEGTWNGDLPSCDAGDISATGRANALRVLNLYRFLADLPEVSDDDTRNAKAQECALTMHANGALSHSPPASWSCRSPDAVEAAGKSNIASGPGVMAVDMYMADWGNDTTMGHRRWILSNQLGPVGLGSTSQYSCMWVIAGSGAAGAAWTAWPPPGVFPFEAIQPSWQGLDDTGWTLQSESIDLEAATVTVTRDDGRDMPVKVETLLPYYGSRYAIRFLPQGWQAEAERRYTVDVGNVGAAIHYTVEVVGCG